MPFEKTTLKTSLFLIATFALQPVFADENESKVYEWQKNRLLNPSEAVIKHEQEKHQVFIYENMQLSDVEKAMDEQFSRMENMMFSGTILPPTGAGKKPEKEDDGC